MRDAVANVRLMLHSIDNNLQTEIAHRDSPHKCLERRLAAWKKWRLSEFDGYRNPDRHWGVRGNLGQTARIVSDIHRRHGSIQNFVVLPFEPQPYSLMAAFAPRSRRSLREQCGRYATISIRLSWSAPKSARVSNFCPISTSLVSPIFGITASTRVVHPTPSAAIIVDSSGETILASSAVTARICVAALPRIRQWYPVLQQIHEQTADLTNAS